MASEYCHYRRHTQNIFWNILLSSSSQVCSVFTNWSMEISKGTFSLLLFYSQHLIHLDEHIWQLWFLLLFLVDWSNYVRLLVRIIHGKSAVEWSWVNFSYQVATTSVFFFSFAVVLLLDFGFVRPICSVCECLTLVNLLQELTQFIGRSNHSTPDVFKKLNFVMRVRYAHLESL